MLKLPLLLDGLVRENYFSELPADLINLIIKFRNSYQTFDLENGKFMVILEFRENKVKIGISKNQLALKLISKKKNDEENILAAVCIGNHQLYAQDDIGLKKYSRFRWYPNLKAENLRGLIDIKIMKKEKTRYDYFYHSNLDITNLVTNKPTLIYKTYPCYPFILNIFPKSGYFETRLKTCQSLNDITVLFEVRIELRNGIKSETIVKNIIDSLLNNSYHKFNISNFSSVEKLELILNIQINDVFINNQIIEKRYWNKYNITDKSTELYFPEHYIF